FGQIAHQGQPCAVTQSPPRNQAGFLNDLYLFTAAVSQPRPKVVAAQREKLPVVTAPFRCRRVIADIKPARVPGGQGVGIRNRLGVALMKCSELGAPALRHLRRKLGVRETGEVEKRGVTAQLLTHENERNLRAQQLQRNGGLESTRPLPAQRGEPLASGPIPHLIVILQKEYERRGRQHRGQFAPWATLVRGAGLTLIDEALRKAASQLLSGPFGI